MPYLCYARKDRETKSRDPITSRYVAQLFEAMGTHRVIGMDLHNLAAFQNAFRCDTEHLSARDLFVRHFAEKNKPLAAICHGAQVLAAAGVLQGKSCSAYPAVGPDVTRAGGKYMDIGIDQAHVDGNLVTAPAWPAHPAWLAKFLNVLGTKIRP